MRIGREKMRRPCQTPHRGYRAYPATLRGVEALAWVDYLREPPPGKPCPVAVPYNARFKPIVASCTPC